MPSSPLEFNDFMKMLNSKNLYQLKQYC